MRIFVCVLLVMMFALLQRLRSSNAFISRHPKSLSSIRALAYVRVSKLDGDEKVVQLNSLEKKGWKWQADRQAITKSFVFADFVEAFGFMTKIAILAEKMNHHPEWYVDTHTHTHAHSAHNN